MRATFWWFRSLFLASVLVLFLLNLGPSSISIGLVPASPDGRQAAAASLNRIVLPLVRRTDDGIDPVLAGRSVPFGIRVSALEEWARLDRIGEAGAQWTRVPLKWNEIEPTMANPPVYNWSKYDEAFRRAAMHGVTPIVTIGNSPGWAAERSCGPVRPGMEDRLVRFVKAAAARYAGSPYNIRYWEFINEPDLDDRNGTGYGETIGGCWGDVPERYAASLKLVYDGLKEANPHAIVLFGGMAFEWFKESPSHFAYHCAAGPYFNPNFLRDVLEVERTYNRPIFDVMNFHYFKFFEPCWSGSDRSGSGIGGKADIIRQHLASSIAHDRPLIVTEYGHYAWNNGQGGEDQQANAVVRMLAEAIAADIRVLIWFTMKDYSSSQQWGLLNSDGSPRQGYIAYAVGTRLLRDVTYVGRVEEIPGVTGLRFQKRTGGCVDVVWTTGATAVQLVFQGEWQEITDRLGRITVLGIPNPENPTIQQSFLIGDDPVYVSRATCP